ASHVGGRLIWRKRDQQGQLALSSALRSVAATSRSERESGPGPGFPLPSCTRRINPAITRRITARGYSPVAGAAAGDDEGEAPYWAGEGTWRRLSASAPPGRTISGSIRAISSLGVWRFRRMSARTPNVRVSSGLNRPEWTRAADP